MKARNMALCALFAALISVCAWLSVPIGDIAFTMQTFAVFLTLELLGGRRGTAAIGVYLCMGAVGLPVFTGFRGGIGVLLGATGGYIAGFLASGLIYWMTTSLSPKKGALPGFLLGLPVCYAFGTGWFCLAYLQGGGAISLGAVLAKCVLPYLLPDLCKLWLARFLSKRIRPLVY